MWVSCLCKSYWYRSHYVFIFSPPNCAFNFYPTFSLHLLTERVVASSWSHNHKVTLKLLYSLLVLPWTPQPQGMRFPPRHTHKLRELRSGSFSHHASRGQHTPLDTLTMWDPSRGPSQVAHRLLTHRNWDHVWSCSVCGNLLHSHS